MGLGLVAAPGNFDIATQRTGGALIVAPDGEIDLATVVIVREAVDRDYERGDDLVIDLRHVGFMDTSGLRYLLELNDRAQQEGFALRLVRGPRPIQRVFEVSGLEPRLTFVSEPSESPADE